MKKESPKPSFYFPQPPLYTNAESVKMQQDNAIMKRALWTIIETAQQAIMAMDEQKRTNPPPSDG